MNSNFEFYMNNKEVKEFRIFFESYCKTEINKKEALSSFEMNLLKLALKSVSTVYIIACGEFNSAFENYAEIDDDEFIVIVRNILNEQCLDFAVEILNQEGSEKCGGLGLRIQDLIEDRSMASLCADDFGIAIYDAYSDKKLERFLSEIIHSFSSRQILEKFRKETKIKTA
ncbi:hypothetical protein RX914_11070 [Pseudomonas syringae pv. actinidiae]|nr:hypothetical protein [Pseudomonas syringae pv. actinidiae]MDU8258036.1 hypothetical protein [Pseudomonas syringae pv. actinidiae]MDU8261163.1 hypothetical protein [Pseudomonas syringae pv. actinidiae]MDU8295510.1 hypothetical protein [Pseudomonas syringae pv. actinidiae]MDU8311480.1 hypothetical protein [Pseudomonas syringae pv. actinidiae]